MNLANLGPAVGTLGTGLSGLGMVSAVGQFNGSGNISRTVQWCILVGVVLSCIGKALAALFPPESPQVKQVLNAHEEKISQLNHDVKTLSEP